MMGFAWLLVKFNYIQIIQQCLHRIPLKSKKEGKAIVSIRAEDCPPAERKNHEK